jgi:hypothetical protein
MMTILEVLFVIVSLALLIMLYWVHTLAIIEDIAKQEAEEYIEEEVDRRLRTADIRVKQQLYVVYGKGYEELSTYERNRIDYDEQRVFCEESRRIEQHRTQPRIRLVQQEVRERIRR